ncbi:MAG: SCO family protein [Saprospiraceae bacterium]
MTTFKYLVLLFAIGTIVSCETGNNLSDDGKPLPILGERDYENGDTIYHQVPDFSFVNQDSNTVNNETFNDKVYVVDFFFTSCPTICPKVKQQMLRVHDRFKSNDKVYLLSHSIDTKRDTVGKLKKYANALDVKSDKWHFVTGDKDKIYDMADNYFIAAQEDPEAPEGFDHSGRLILVDRERHIRAFCEGTDPESVDKFMLDIDKLLNE